MSMWDNLVDRIKGVSEPEYGGEYDEGGAAPALDMGYDEGYDPGLESSEKFLRFAKPNGRTHKVLKVKGVDYNAKRKEAADCFKEGHIVYINMEEANKEVTGPVLNFLGGMAYALDGDLKPISQNVYVMIPHGDEIGGDVYGDELDEEYRVSNMFGTVRL